MNERSQARGTLFAYPWDVAPLEAGRVAEELAGMGLQTLTLAACYHAGKFVRPHAADGGRVVFPRDGHVHCRIDPDEGFGRVRPLPNPAAEALDLFAHLGKAGVRLRAWLVLLHNTPLGLLHPDLTARNALGDPYPYSLCPSHSEVRDYAVALCRQVAARYELSGLTLETPGWLPYRHGFHHEFELIALDPALEADLGLCFCEACRAKAASAGIDAEALRKRIAHDIDASFALPVDRPTAESRAWMMARLALDAELSAFHRWRCGVVTDLVAEIRAAVRPEVAVHVVPSIAQPGGMAFLEGSDLAALARAADGVEACLYGRSPAQVLTDHAMARAALGEGDLRVVLRPASPDWGGEGPFAAAVAGLRAAGQRDFGFYNYGHLRRENLAWIGRAMRTA